MNQKKPIKLLSLFSGYGGAEFALQKAGIDFEVVGYSEIDKFAIECYEQNHRNTQHLEYGAGRYEKINSKIKNYGDATKINEKELPDFDLLTGGFPCPSFSVAGKGLGIKDKRGQLFWDIIRIAKEKQPKYMLLENVKGLTNKRHKEVFDLMLKGLDEIGYDVHWKVLNSKEHGIPQNRERVWFVCIHRMHEWRHKLERAWVDETHFEFPKETELKIFLKDIWEDEVDEKYYLTEKQISKLIARKSEVFNWKLVKMVDNKGKDTCKKADISFTLTGSGRNCGSNQVFQRWRRIRKLTPKECFRLMGFLNDEIKLEGISTSQQYKLAGNGGEINVVSKILENLLK